MRNSTPPWCRSGPTTGTSGLATFVPAMRGVNARLRSMGIKRLPNDHRTDAHPVGELRSVARERAHRPDNDLLRNLPDGLAGVVDFDKHPMRQTCDPRYIASDKLHFGRGPSVEKARAVVAAGVAARFIASA